MIDTEIKIDEDNNVIRFKSQHQNRTACQHTHVIVSESVLEITCKQCGVKDSDIRHATPEEIKAGRRLS